MIRIEAFAKVNLGLRVGDVRPDGFHPLHSIFQSIDWSDRLELRFAVGDEGDSIGSWAGGPVIDGFANLAWKAVAAVRDAAGSSHRIRLRLDKRIPAAAGLGGGSADAAAALQAAVRMLDVPVEQAQELASALGSDVPFCMSGGTARVTGRGDVVEALDTIDGYGLAVVVPPIELRTPDVFGRWDALGGPGGDAVSESALPPTLRAHAPITNDLYPAAVAIAPALDDWRAELESAWGRPVLMSGSGPSLMGFCVDRDEAEAALAVVPAGVRATRAVRPIPYGWRRLRADG